MRVCKIVKFIVFSILLSQVSVGFSQSKKKPNIILIMSDDLGYETIGANGNDDKLTPNLDALAASGMLFENCHAMPLCTPSRVQLMTGKYNNRNYIGFGLLDSTETTFAQVLQKEGYKTCIAGKWQLWGNDIQSKLAGGRQGSLPHQSGFDKVSMWQVDDAGSRYKDPTVYTDEKKSVLMKGEFGDNVFTTYIENFIRDNKKGPFMIYYPMALTHDPFVPTPISANYDTWVETPKTVSPSYYKDMLKYHDDLIGRIVKKVDDLGLRENTIIIYTGDNGTSPQIISNFRGGKLRGNKGQTNHRGTHVPLIVNWENQIKPGTVNKSLVDFTDFFPTLLDLAGISKKKVAKLDGKSFYPQLKGDMSAKRDWIFSFYDPKWGGDKFPRTAYAQTVDWKVYESGKIFNLKDDLEELKPLPISAITGKDLVTVNMLKKAIEEKLKD